MTLQWVVMFALPFIPLVALLIGLIRVAGAYDQKSREKAADLLTTWSIHVSHEMRLARTFAERLGDDQEIKKLATGLGFRIAEDNLPARALAAQCLKKSLPQAANGFIAISMEDSVLLDALVADYLNLTESILAAAFERVAHRRIIFDQFHYVAIDGNTRMLERYRRVVAEGGVNPYPYITEFISIVERGEIQRARGYSLGTLPRRLLWR